MKWLLVAGGVIAAVAAVPLLVIVVLLSASVEPAAAACVGPVASSGPSATPSGPTGSATVVAESSADICAPPSAGELAARAVAWALSHLGDAYVAGAHGPNAFDCSTFTYEAYRAAGLDWPMQISYGQYLDRTHVTLVPLDQAQPGDLLFFDTGQGNSWFNPVTHVAIVVDPVAGTMVHAANPTVGVVISNYRTGAFYLAHPPVGPPDANGVPMVGSGGVSGRIVQAP